MSYSAMIAKVTNIKKHPNANRLNIGNVSGK
jgi:tRNA-binding EMAP/Myf-like protein